MPQRRGPDDVADLYGGQSGTVKTCEAPFDRGGASRVGRAGGRQLTHAPGNGDASGPLLPATTSCYLTGNLKSDQCGMRGRSSGAWWMRRTRLRFDHVTKLLIIVDKAREITQPAQQVIGPACLTFVQHHGVQVH